MWLPGCHWDGSSLANISTENVQLLSVLELNLSDLDTLWQGRAGRRRERVSPVDQQLAPKRAGKVQKHLPPGESSPMAVSNLSL